MPGVGAKKTERADQMATSTVPLGSQGLQVSRLAFGCAGLSGAYGFCMSDEESISILNHAFEGGITFFDTADFYGPYTNEILLGKALKHLPREKVQVATKCGLAMNAAGKLEICGKANYVRKCCEESLKRLETDYIDLLYQHRIDTTVPIEETIGELKKLIEEGKVKYIGLAEASPETIRRAHAVHPISVLQMEWSLWSRDIESEIVPLCRELGIGIVAYSPLGCGFFAGRGVVEGLEDASFQKKYPRFNEENLEKNKSLYFRLESLAKKHKCTPAELALAWVLHQGNDVIPLPGTTKIKNVDSNISALKVKLTNEDIKELSTLVNADDVAGGRIISGYEYTGWKHANTPPLSLSV